jgi:hypothetical protein
MDDQMLHTYWQQKVFTKLLGLQYIIVYRKGSENRVANALSRHPAPTDQLVAISTCTRSWWDTVNQGYNADPKALEMLQALMVKPDAIPNFIFCDGIQRFKGNVWIGNNVPLQHQILEVVHSSTMQGHLGFPVTYMKLQQLFAWQGMKASAQQFVQSCSICQQDKSNRSKY